ncbi:MAG: hypothetical protein AAGI38_18070 [Bacteroidota bacterium]
MALADLLSFREVTIGLFTFLVFAALAFVYQRKRRLPAFDAQLLFWGLIARLLSGIAFAMAHVFVLARSDSFRYYQCITDMWEAWWESPQMGLEQFWAEAGSQVLPLEVYFAHWSTLTVIKAGTLVSLLTFNSYWALTFSFGTFAFGGLWAMFRGFCRIFPQYKKVLGISLIFFPSVLFWGSGLMKDPLVLGLLGWWVYSWLNLIVFQRRFWISVLILLVTTLLIAIIKVYILYGLLIATLVMLMVWGWKQWVHLPILWLYGMGTALVCLIILTTPDLGFRFVIHQQWHVEQVALRNPFSYYSLGDISGGWSGILPKIPPAIWVSFFRPYPWETDISAMSLYALESFLLLGITIWLVGRMVVSRNWTRLFRNTVWTFCWSFSLSVATVLGLYTYSFGTMARYRILILPLYCVLLLFIYTSTQKENPGISENFPAENG